MADKIELIVIIISLELSIRHASCIHFTDYLKIAPFLIPTNPIVFYLVGPSKLQQFWEVRGTESSSGIPTFSDRESSSIASDCASAEDIGESLVSLAVQPWVQETKHWFTLG